VAYPQPAIEAGSTKTGRWLRERRRRLALWVAIAEGVIVAVSPDLTKWTVLVIAIIVLGFYALAGRNINWDVGRELSWIAAAIAGDRDAGDRLRVIAKPIASFCSGSSLLVALVYLFSDAKRT
jgi:hypothetical protein